MRKRRDVYTKRAKQEGHRSRAYYKLQQLDRKYKIFHPKQLIIDLCGAPGGFSQVARDCTNGNVSIILVDLARIKPMPGISNIIKGDITDQSTVLKIREVVERNRSIHKEIVVLADCSPNVSGNWLTDQAIQIWLSEVALGISNYFIAAKFVSKAFQGETFNKFIEEVKTYYEDVKIRKPRSSRRTSAEVYVIAQKRRDLELKLYDSNSLLADE
ncbi:MAG: SAM-dependent methyltransferase [Candidatus Hodarchaeales archaeon]|jgi:23S rRNA (uridine2552-2'-O)-methyltransferase